MTCSKTAYDQQEHQDDHILSAPDMAEQVQDVMRDEGRTMSQLIREALRKYMEEREWLRTIRYGRLRVRHAEQEDPQGE